MTVLRRVRDGLGEVLRSWRGALLVQVQSLGFWEGKEFRAYREFSVTDTSIILRFRATTPFLLTFQSLDLIQGEMRATIVTGATPSGVWSAIPTVVAKNRISSNPVSTQAIEAGGTYTGGTEREVLLAAAGTGGPVSAQGNGQNLAGIRGLPAGDYYITLTAVGLTRGVYSIEWEDVPA
jgi:hypothetical protein